MTERPTPLTDEELDRIPKLLKKYEDLFRDRNEWREQHENLLGIKRQLERELSEAREKLKEAQNCAKTSAGEAKHYMAEALEQHSRANRAERRVEAAEQKLERRDALLREVQKWADWRAGKVGGGGALYLNDILERIQKELGPKCQHCGKELTEDHVCLNPLSGV